MVLTSLAQATLEYPWKSIPFQFSSLHSLYAPRSRDQWLDWALIVGEFPGNFYFFLEMLGLMGDESNDKDKEKAISFSLFFKTHLSCADMKLYCSAAGYDSVCTCFIFFSYQGEFFGNL